MLIQTGLELLVDLEINAELPVSDDKLDWETGKVEMLLALQENEYKQKEKICTHSFTYFF